VEYVKHNYKNVKSVQITPDHYHFKPTGTLGIGGHINNEDKLRFYITFLIEDNGAGEMQTIVKASDFPGRKDEEKETE